MKNFEKYEKEIIELSNGNVAFGVLKIGGKPCKCNNMECCNCLLGELANRLNLSCNNAKTLWFYQEYKEPIKLSRLEYELLKYYIEHGYQYIARDDGRVPFAYDTKPRKMQFQWNVTKRVKRTNFYDLFSFIKWEDEEPYKIQDILDNCEVVENEKLYNI